MTTKRTYEELLAVARAKVLNATVAPKVEQLKLPFWPDEVRGVPNAVLRGALFTVAQERETIKETRQIAAVEGIEVSFKGERFNQTDLDLVEMLLHLQRFQVLGDKVEFSIDGMLRALNRGVSGKHHAELKNQLMRLIGGAIEIKWTKERKAFAGTFITGYFRDDDTGRYVVTFNPKMLQLYGQGHSYIDWSQRQALGQNSLAKWLHGFYASHAAPFAYKVSTLHRLCGSTVVRLAEFRRMLRLALAKLVEIGAFVSFEIEPKTDTLTIQKTPTSSQQRHLNRKK
jgi:hypothetical protein